MKDSCLAGEVLPKRLLPRQYVEGTALCLRSQQSTKQLRQLLLKRHCASLCRKRQSPCFTAPLTQAVIQKFSSKSRTAPSKSPTSAKSQFSRPSNAKGSNSSSRQLWSPISTTTTRS